MTSDNSRRYGYESRTLARARTRQQFAMLGELTRPLVMEGTPEALQAASQIAKRAAEESRPRPLQRPKINLAPPPAPAEEEQSPLRRLGGFLKDVAGDTLHEFAGGFAANSVERITLGKVKREDTEAKFDEWGIAGDAIRIGTSPATVFTAGQGAAIGAGLRGAGGLGRIAALLADPVAPAAGFGTRLAAETAVGLGAQTGAEQVAQRLPESTPGAVRTPLALLGGLLGGTVAAGGVQASRGALKAAGETGPLLRGEATQEARILPGSRSARGAEPDRPINPEVDDSPVDAIVQGVQNTAAPPPTSLAQTFGVQPPTVGLNAMQRGVNAVREAAAGAGARGKLAVVDDSIATPAFENRARDLQRVSSVATREREGTRKLITEAGFDFDEKFRIQSLAGKVKGLENGPTIQDLAAHRAEYAPWLTPEQSAALGQIELLHQPYGAVVTETGLDLASRADVQPGGFYMHRAYQPSDEVRVSIGSKAGGKEAFEKAERYSSMHEAIDDGLTPLAPWDAFGAYVEDVGGRATNRYYADWLKNLTDEEGIALGQTAADRTNPQLRRRVEQLRSQISGRVQTARNQAVRGTAQEQELARAEGVAQRGTELADKAAERAEVRHLAGSTDEVIAAAERELTILEREAGKQRGRVSAASKRAEGTAARAGQTGSEITNLRNQLDAIKADWEKAQSLGAQTPQGRGAIGLQELQGTDFPLKLANAANVILEKELPKGGDILGAVRAVNGLLRGLRATLDASFMGIQGAIGAVNDPAGYGRAVKAAYRAFGEEGAAGNALAMFDERAVTTGRLTSREWAAMGVQQQSSNTEFAVRGLLDRGPIRGSNRAFGVFGDVMRQEYADTLLEGAVKRGQIMSEDIALIRSGQGIPPSVKAIADHANLTTGWASKPFAGEWGEILQFAPRFFQSQLELSANALAKWGPQHPEGVLARKALIKYLGLAAGMTHVINQTIGEDIGNYWAPVEDGRVNSNFMRFRAGGRDYSLLGPWDSLLKAIAHTATGDPGYLARTKASPALQLTWDLVTGEDFMGNKVRDNPADFATWLVGQFAPFSAGGIPELAAQAQTDPLGALGGGLADVGGIKSAPLSPNEELDQVAQRTYGNDFWSLEADEKDKIKGGFPDLWKRSIEQSGDQRQQAEAVRAEMSALEQQDDQKLLDRAITRQQYRAALDDRRNDQAARLKQIYLGSEDREPRNAVERYSAIIRRHEDGDIVDWESVDAEVEALPASDRAAIQRAVGLGHSPLAKAFLQQKKQYNALPVYKGYTVDEAREIDALWDEVRAAGGDNQLRQLRAIRRLAGEADPRVVRAVRRRAMGISLEKGKERERFKKQNPALAVLMTDGKLTEADRAKLEQITQEAA